MLISRAEARYCQLTRTDAQSRFACMDTNKPSAEIHGLQLHVGIVSHLMSGAIQLLCAVSLEANPQRTYVLNK